MEEAFAWVKERKKVRCELCAYRCLISKGKKGLCGTRINKDNKLLATNYGSVVGLEIGKIEDKNIFHFLPDADVLSVALEGKWVLPFDKIKKVKRKITPEKLIDIAEEKNVKVIVYTGVEPTTWIEYVYRTARLARRVNIKNVLVTTGIISDIGLKKIVKYIDAALVHFVASGNEDFMKKFGLFKSAKPTYATIKRLYKHRVHVEIANTIVPQIGDDMKDCKKLMQWIVGKLGGEIPVHILRFQPFGKLKNIPKTPLATLKKCIEVGKKSGLRYVYIGNVKEKTELENTYCYNCRQLIIERRNGKVKSNNLYGDRCPYCGVRINVVTK